MKLILASGSPRRRELMERMGLQFEVRAADADETLVPGLSAQEQVVRLSRIKAEAVARTLTEEAVIVAADTVVVLDGIILGKPKDQADAKRMLTAFSGRCHHVLTGLTVLGPKGVETHCEETEVHFRPLSEGEIDRYIATGEPMDKAGAYGIQGLGSLLVSGIDGDYFNVMGLPVYRLGRILAQFGLDLLEQAAR